MEIFFGFSDDNPAVRRLRRAIGCLVTMDPGFINICSLNNKKTTLVACFNIWIDSPFWDLADLGAENGVKD